MKKQFSPSVAEPATKLKSADVFQPSNIMEQVVYNRAFQSVNEQEIILSRNSAAAIRISA